MPLVGHKISLEAIEEFRRIYQEECREEITLAEATDMAYRVLSLYRLLARKLPDGYVPIRKTTPPDEGSRPPSEHRT